MYLVGLHIYINEICRIKVRSGVIRAGRQFNCIRVEEFNWAGSKRRGELDSAACMIKFYVFKG